MEYINRNFITFNSMCIVKIKRELKLFENFIIEWDLRFVRIEEELIWMWKSTNYYFSLSREKNTTKKKDIRVQRYVTPALFLHHPLYLLAAGCNLLRHRLWPRMHFFPFFHPISTYIIHVNSIYLPISSNKISKTVLCRSLLISVLIIQHCQLNNLYWLKKWNTKEIRISKKKLYVTFIPRQI